MQIFITILLVYTVIDHICYNFHYGDVSSLTQYKANHKLTFLASGRQVFLQTLALACSSDHHKHDTPWNALYLLPRLLNRCRWRGSLDKPLTWVCSSVNTGMLLMSWFSNHNPLPPFFNQSLPISHSHFLLSSNPHSSHSLLSLVPPTLPLSLLCPSIVQHPSVARNWHFTSLFCIWVV